MASDSQGSGGSSNVMIKVVSGVFAAVVAPLVVTVGSNFIQKKLDPADDARKTETVSKKPITTAKKGTKPSPARPSVSEKKDSNPTVHLFNGKDLTNFTTYLGPPEKGKPAYGRNADPEKVFSVQNGELHISGKVYGSLETVKSYEDYHLYVEYRFGEKKWPPRENLPKASGVQVHCTGPDGAINDTWMVGYRIFIDDIGAGTIRLDGTPEHRVSLVAEQGKLDSTDGKKKSSRIYYKPGAPSTPVVSGTIYRLGLKGPNFSVPGAEIKARSDWNTLECICSGDQLTVLFNGIVVNTGTKLSQSKGKIAIRSDAAEIFFRKIDLKPLPKGVAAK